MNKDSIIFTGLFAVLCAAIGLITAVIFTLSIPLFMVLGAAAGILIGIMADAVVNQNKLKK